MRIPTSDTWSSQIILVGFVNILEVNATEAFNDNVKNDVTRKNVYELKCTICTYQIVRKHRTHRQYQHVGRYFTMQC